MDEHFIILGLPRSMTAWVSCFLTCGEVFCQHDVTGHYEPADFPDILNQPFAVSGVADTGMVLNWERWALEYPNAKFVWVQRNWWDCTNALYAATEMDFEVVQKLMGKLVKAAGNFLTSGKHFVISTDELQTEDGARRLWNYCAPHHPLPPAHLRKMMSLKVTVHPKVYAEAAATLNQLTAV